MTKSDLKTGYKVQLRDGSAYIVLRGVETEFFSGDCLMDAKRKSWLDMDGYSEDLIYYGVNHDSLPTTQWDIIRVFRQDHPYQIQDPGYENAKESELLWERPVVLASQILNL